MTVGPSAWKGQRGCSVEEIKAEGEIAGDRTFAEASTGAGALCGWVQPFGDGVRSGVDVARSIHAEGRAGPRPGASRLGET